MHSTENTPVWLHESPLLRRTPLLSDAWRKNLVRMMEHPDAPRWNHGAGDRLDANDLDALHSYARALEQHRRPWLPGRPPGELQHWVQALRQRVVSFAERIPEGFVLERQWNELPTTSREDIALHPERLIPLDADLSALIVFRTAGTTGHALLVPHSVRAAASYQPLVAFALARHGVELELDHRHIACFLLGNQADTVTYACVLSFWNGAGFAKLNLSPGDWKDPQSMARFLQSLEPHFLTGDPLTFAELLRQRIPLKVRALLTTAVALNDGLRDHLSAFYGCPVIDWYSLTETGPIGYACTNGSGYHILPHDVYVEAVGPDGSSLPPGERGEITVTGGRNPFLPLLRYRTGDWGCLEFSPCSCGDPMPRLLGLEGRAPVLLRATDGRIVNPVDLSRLLRAFPLVQHEFIQLELDRCELRVRPIDRASTLDLEGMRAALLQHFGPDMALDITVDAALGDRPGGAKVLPYQSHLRFEE